MNRARSLVTGRRVGAIAGALLVGGYMTGVCIQEHIPTGATVAWAVISALVGATVVMATDRRPQ